MEAVLGSARSVFKTFNDRGLRGLGSHTPHEHHDERVEDLAHSQISPYIALLRPESFGEVR